MIRKTLEVLLVEDEPADIELTRRVFRSDLVSSNLNVVRDGVEALRYLRREGEHAHAPRPDLILLDLNMPRLDGRDVLRAIKSDANLKTIPVVVMTTSQSDRDVARSYVDAANSYVTKPVDLHEFKKTIQAVTQYWFSIVQLPPPAENPPDNSRVDATGVD